MTKDHWRCRSGDAKIQEQAEREHLTRWSSSQRRRLIASRLMLLSSCSSHSLVRNYKHFRRQVMIASRLMLRTSSKISFSPKELHMFLKMSHVSIRMTPVNLVGLGHPEPKHAKILNDFTRTDVCLSQGTHKNIIRHSPLMNKNSS